MSNAKTIQPTSYARRKYNLTQPVAFDVAVNYAGALMAIAGADSELAEAELQWFIDEQRLLMVDPDEYIAAIRKLDWKSIGLEKRLGGISYDFPINFRRAMLYQAIRMSRADGVYGEKERAAAARAAELLGIERSVLHSLTALAEMEDACERLRLSLFETDVETILPV